MLLRALGVSKILKILFDYNIFACFQCLDSALKTNSYSERALEKFGKHILINITKNFQTRTNFCNRKE